MHLTQNKNFATLFLRSPDAIDSGHKALATLKGVDSCRAIIHNRRVVGHEDRGWVIIMQSHGQNHKGFLVI